MAESAAMSLGTGARLGVYEVLGSLGAGGMGEVYRARDTRLKREVALKILPPSFVTDPERLARFQREAEVLAALNHPNIAAIHGVEESADVTALVMELVEGETLSDRITRGAIPLDEALPLARQIAEALEAAHERGIIHRDLKPANIKVRPDSVVKVLDFGLAKLIDTGSGTGDQGSGRGLTGAPTITSPAMTQAGIILGTAAYMSPEQAKGRNADKRSDIWAFGCVFYEVLAGKGRSKVKTSPTPSRMCSRHSRTGTRCPRRCPCPFNGCCAVASKRIHGSGCGTSATHTSKSMRRLPGNRMMAVSVTSQPTFSAGRPTMLFEGEYLASVFPLAGITYDVTRDGQRFLMVKEQAAPPAQINVVVNWFEELKRLVPIDGAGAR